MSVGHQRKTKRIYLDRSCNGTLMSPEEFDAVRDWDERFRYELIHGVVIVTPPPGEGERGPNDWLGHWLMSYSERRPEGAALDATLPEHTIPVGENRRRADRAIWCGLGRLPDPELDIPTIVAEFVSKRKRDRVRDYEEKRWDYLTARVVEYWVIDRFQRTMTVYKGPAENPTEYVVKETENYQTPLLPGFTLPLGRLLEIADAWDASKRRRKAKAKSDSET